MEGTRNVKTHLRGCSDFPVTEDREPGLHSPVIHMDKMYLWLLAIPIGTCVLWFLWTTYTHPVQVLIRQAANMNWVYAGNVKKNGYRNVRLVRGHEEAVIWRKTGKVSLVVPPCPISFDDFIEVDPVLGGPQSKAESSREHAEHPQRPHRNGDAAAHG